MTLTWVICGAGRGVGKTHLGQRLCEVLPDSAYAKQGCGTPRPGKPGNLFRTEDEITRFVDSCGRTHTHVIVESNAFARQGRGDVIIFIEGISVRTDLRPDVELLRSMSHLQVGPNVSPRRWKALLREKLADESQYRAVYEVLLQHRENLTHQAKQSDAESRPA